VRIDGPLAFGGRGLGDGEKAEDRDRRHGSLARVASKTTGVVRRRFAGLRARARAFPARVERARARMLPRSLPRHNRST
jgi:hypothetical protein